MSSTILKIIPSEPSFVPGEIAQKNARSFLAQLYTKNQIELKTTENTEFIDQGSNFESVSCNLCGQQIEMEYWQNAMDIVFENQFKNLKIITPCCGKSASLNDLDYKMPAGFARYVMSIDNPIKELSEDDVSHLRDILQADLKIIWAHY